MPSSLGCLRPPDENRQVSREIDKRISGWMKQYMKSIKLLLLGQYLTKTAHFRRPEPFNNIISLILLLSFLGAGESGKTTIIKQMKILHVQGFSVEERREKAFEIKRNVFESIKVRLAQCVYRLLFVTQRSNVLSLFIFLYRKLRHIWLS